MDREKNIIKVSIMGIVVNLILVTFKAVVGFIAGSIAIILDALNNLSDALSSIITIIGTKLAKRKPDKKHPYGYGRIEYLSSIIIAIIVLIAGISSLKESFEKALHPNLANYSIVSLIVIVVAIFVKYFFGKYVKSEGEKLNSSSLIASGVDALSDAVLSFSTFVAALISYIWHISLEGYLGLVISIIILKSAYEILKDTVNDMIGVRAESDLTKKIKNTFYEYKEVQGVYDLVLHNYVPENIIGTAHIQLEDNLNAYEIHKLTRKITLDIYNKYGIVFTIGIYAANDREYYKDIKNYVMQTIKKYDNIKEIHGFYVDEEEKTISFDLVFSFEEDNSKEIVKEIKNELKEKFPKYNYTIILDIDFTD